MKEGHTETKPLYESGVVVLPQTLIFSKSDFFRIKCTSCGQDDVELSIINYNKILLQCQSCGM